MRWNGRPARSRRSTPTRNWADTGRAALVSEYRDDPDLRLSRFSGARLEVRLRGHSAMHRRTRSSFSILVAYRPNHPAQPRRRPRGVKSLFRRAGGQVGGMVRGRGCSRFGNGQCRTALGTAHLLSTCLLRHAQHGSASQIRAHDGDDIGHLASPFTRLADGSAPSGRGPLLVLASSVTGGAVLTGEVQPYRLPACELRRFAAASGTGREEVLPSIHDGFGDHPVTGPLAIG